MTMWAPRAKLLAVKPMPKLLPIDPDELNIDPDAVWSALLTNRALIHKYLNHRRDAIIDATEALSFDPCNSIAHFERGLLLLSINNFKPAFEDFVEAGRLNPALSKRAKYYAEKARKSFLQALHIEQLRSQMNPAPVVRQRQPMIKKVSIPVSNLTIDFDAFNEDTAKAVMNELRSGRMFPPSIVETFLDRIEKLNRELPNIVHISSPKPGCVIKVVGDTHGQFQDLVYIFDTFGCPTPENPYLFNGDYVDRGSQGLEILLTLFAWKLANPNCIYLNRGNHEADMMNIPYGFESEMSSKMSVEMFRKCSKVFEALPVGHIIGDAVLVVHGGLFGDDNVTIETIQGMPRFGQPPDSGPMNDILWSDPMDQMGHAPSPRGVTKTFGPDVTEKFLKENNLELLIRSHQVQDEGYLVQHNGKCITVFSAPNYIGRMNNKGAIVELEWSEDGKLQDPRFKQFPAQPIPPNFRPMMFTAVAAYC